MRVFALKSCDTCRKALKSLAAAGIDVAVTDVRADGLEAEEIEKIIAEFGDKAVNRASTTWRGLSEDEKTQSAEVLLSNHPTLLKRPVITDGTVWTLGWKADAQAHWLGAAG